jgi:hypothetical protein
MNIRERIDQARTQHDIKVILGTSKKLIVCPLPGHVHGSHTPSFSIFFKDGAQRFKCHGNCSLTGDVIDLMGYMNIPGYNRHDGRMVEEALNLLEQKAPVTYVIPEKDVRLSQNEWRRFLPPDEKTIAYARTRGLNDETLVKFKVGTLGNYMTLPCFEFGELVGVKVRNTTHKGVRFFQLEGSRQGIFNFDAINLTDQTVLVTKGEIPCMLLDQMGFLACAPTAGEGSTTQKLKDALVFARVIVIGDNDGPGRKLGEKRAEILNARLVFPPERYQDIDKMILDMDISDAGSLIQSWIDRLAASKAQELQP